MSVLDPLLKLHSINLKSFFSSVIFYATVTGSFSVVGYSHKGFEHHFSQTFIPAKALISTITNSHRSKIHIHMRVHTHAM